MESAYFGGTRKRSGSSSESTMVKKPRALSPTQTDILELLEVSGIQDDAQIQQRFREIAHELFQAQICCVHAGSVAYYELLEFEFYWNNHSWHPDPFCHTGPRNFCEWHFHKAPRRSPVETPKVSTTAAGGFRGGTRKGLDLSLGPKYPSDLPLKEGQIAHHGGVLLRSMRRIKDGVIISGPSLLVDELLRVFEAPNPNTLVSTVWENDVGAYREPWGSASQISRMYLVPKKVSMSGKTYYTSPRVGLDLSNPETKPVATDDRVIFIGRQYRYFRNPELLLANGRLQTFMGLMCDAKLNAVTEGRMSKLIATGGKFSEKTVDKYISEFRRGQASGALEKFIGLGGKSSGPAIYLQLMGTLHGLNLIR